MMQGNIYVTSSYEGSLLDKGNKDRMNSGLSLAHFSHNWLITFFLFFAWNFVTINDEKWQSQIFLVGPKWPKILFFQDI